MFVIAARIVAKRVRVATRIVVEVARDIGSRELGFGFIIC